MDKAVVHTCEAPAAIGPYSQAIDVGGFVFTSGQLGADATTGQLADGVEAQAELAMKNIGAILCKAGLTHSDIVKTTVFVADLADFAKVNAVYERFFDSAYPARSCVQVAALPKNALVEIECIAARKEC